VIIETLYPGLRLVMFGLPLVPAFFKKNESVSGSGFCSSCRSWHHPCFSPELRLHNYRRDSRFLQALVLSGTKTIQFQNCNTAQFMPHFISPVLACLISGIVGSHSANYPKIASKVPDRTKLESRVKRYSRYINEADPKQEVYLMPFAEPLLRNLADYTLVLLMDGSDVRRNCVALMLSVKYRGRALPIGWLVISGKKGHFSQDRHVQLVSAVKKTHPSGCRCGLFRRW